MTNYIRPNGRGIPANLKHLDRDIQALELRKQGFSYRQIAEMIGVGQAEVKGLIDYALTEVHNKLSETTEQVRTIELARLDALVEAHWPSRTVPKSAEIILKTMAQRARYLGLEAPSVDMLDAATSLRDFLTAARANIGMSSPTHPETEA